MGAKRLFIAWGKMPNGHYTYSQKAFCSSVFLYKLSLFGLSNVKCLYNNLYVCFPITHVDILVVTVTDMVRKTDRGAYGNQKLDDALKAISDGVPLICKDIYIIYHIFHENPHIAHFSAYFGILKIAYA